MRAVLLALLAACTSTAHPTSCGDTQRAETERDRVLANERVHDPRRFECDDRNCRLGELCIDHAGDTMTECRTAPHTGTCYSLPPACRDEPTCACVSRAVADRDPKATEEACTDVGGHVTFVERD
ncbi:MAG TPA: hypothetical protein VGF94_29635 [Kofleriaceae bacterium]|jgi:hypothetical protein